MASTKRVQDAYTHYSSVLNGMVDKAIASVAATKKVAMVLSKNVQTKDSEEKLVLWGGADITDDVLKSLKDNYKLACWMPGTGGGTAAPDKPAK